VISFFFLTYNPLLFSGNDDSGSQCRIMWCLMCSDFLSLANLILWFVVFINSSYFQFLQMGTLLFTSFGLPFGNLDGIINKCLLMAKLLIWKYDAFTNWFLDINWHFHFLMKQIKIKKRLLWWISAGVSVIPDRIFMYKQNLLDWLIKQTVKCAINYEH
jgi:hypothetical protein